MERNSCTFSMKFTVGSDTINICSYKLGMFFNLHALTKSFSLLGILNIMLIGNRRTLETQVLSPHVRLFFLIFIYKILEILSNKDINYTKLYSIFFIYLIFSPCNNQWYLYLLKTTIKRRYVTWVHQLYKKISKLLRSTLCLSWIICLWILKLS